MKIDRNYYDNYEYKGRMYLFDRVSDDVGAYIFDAGYYTVFFELDTDEEIGVICESENRTNFKDYYNATISYGWDGKRNTKKEYLKTLCTRAEYEVAQKLLLNEYRNRK